MNREYIAETFEHAGYRVQIIADQDARSPEEYGDDGLFIVTTRNRSFELLHDGDDARECFENKALCAKYWIFPLRAYVHSGVALSLYGGYPFNDQWDSGQIGFVFVAKSEWRYRERVTKKCTSARKAAEGYVETWNQYLSGDVWGYVIEAVDCTDECEDDITECACPTRDIDSCWGHYGLDYCRNEAKSSAEAYRAIEDQENAKLDAIGIPCLSA